MTRAELNELETLFIERSDSLDASSYDIPELIAQAREALELREAAMSLARILERILDDIPIRRDWLDPELERVARDVIQNARAK